MTIDAIASEPQFLTHLAPVWAALPRSARGVFLIHPDLVGPAAAVGIEVTPLDVEQVRTTPQQPPRLDGMPALVASVGDVKVGRRIGYGPFVFLEHGAGQSYDSSSAVMASYPGGPDRADNAVFLCPNDYSADRWRRAYPAARVEAVGCPRLDGLPRRVVTPAREPVVAVSFHGDWPMGVPFGGTALGDWLPSLPALARAYTVIGHAHPGKGWGARMERLYRREGIRFVADFDDVCRQADVYVCDNSSTIFEFASTGRPVVLLNAAAWKPPHGPGLRFWDAAGVGQNLWPGDDLVAAVGRALDELPADVAAREQALRFVYPQRRGAAKRAAAVIVAWLAEREEVAA